MRRRRQRLQRPLASPRPAAPRATRRTSRGCSTRATHKPLPVLTSRWGRAGLEWGAGWGRLRLRWLPFPAARPAGWAGRRAAGLPDWWRGCSDHWHVDRRHRRLDLNCRHLARLECATSLSTLRLLHIHTPSPCHPFQSVGRRQHCDPPPKKPTPAHSRPSCCRCGMTRMP